MNKKILFEFNLINNLFFYIFGILFLQIIELFLPIRLTPIIFVTFIILVLVGIMNKKILIGFDFFIVGMVVALYLVSYYLKLKSIFSYVYPPAILAALLPLFNKNNWYKIDKILKVIISRCSLVYLLLNIFLYTVHLDKCFQVADIIQFKGALPHTNMLCAVLISLFVFNINGKELIGYINRLCCFLLVFATMSRTYIIAICLLVIIRILVSYGKRTTIGTKLFIFSTVALILGPAIVHLTIDYVPSLQRFIMFGFMGNGRQFLREGYFEVIGASSFYDQLFGIRVTERYVNLQIQEFAHSFTENSYVGIYLLFGIFGSLFFGYYLIKTIFKSKNFQTVAIIFVYLLTFLVQDSLLSVQTGLITFTAIYFVVLCNRNKSTKTKFIGQNIVIRPKSSIKKIV